MLVQSQAAQIMANVINPSQSAKAGGMSAQAIVGIGIAGILIGVIITIVCESRTSAFFFAPQDTSLPFPSSSPIGVAKALRGQAGAVQRGHAVSAH